jgi:hypothetical protein
MKLINLLGNHRKNKQCRNISPLTKGYALELGNATEENSFSLKKLLQAHNNVQRRKMDRGIGRY